MELIFLARLLDAFVFVNRADCVPWILCHRSATKKIISSPKPAIENEISIASCISSDISAPLKLLAIYY